MSPLRKKMIDAMRLRGFSIRTHESYLGAVSRFAKYHGRCPTQLGIEDIQGFMAYLALERNLSGASCRLHLNGLRFLYLQVLGWPQFDVPVKLPKKPQRIPELLTRREVAGIFNETPNDKHRMLLSLCYGCGLRMSELVGVEVRDIDGERGQLRVRQGKGAKDRLVVMSPTLLQALRGYWRAYRPQRLLFSGAQADCALTVVSAQRIYARAKARARVDKDGGIHGLRHASARHQLAAGLPIHVLQRRLGHGNIQSTLRYVHWVPNDQRGKSRMRIWSQPWRRCHERGGDGFADGHDAVSDGLQCAPPTASPPVAVVCRRRYSGGGSRSQMATLLQQGLR